MDPRDRYRNDVETLRRIVESHQTGMWSAMPLIVHKLNAKQNTVEADSAIKLRHVKPDKSTEWLNLPRMADLPVFYYGGGGVSLTVPVKKGNEGLAIFASRSIDKWWHQGGVQEQTHARMHDISDGFVLPGFRSRPNWLKNVNEDSFQIRTDDGKTHFTMDPRSGGAISMVSTSNPTTMTGKAWNINVESSELKAQQNIKIDTPLTNATGDMKVNGRMDASGGFFKNGIPIGGGGSGGGGGGTVISVEAGTGLVGSGTTTEVIISLQIPVTIDHGGTGATTASQALTNLGGVGINSPNFTGDPRVPTPPAGDSDTSIANTAWVNTYFLKLTGGTVSGNLAVTGTLNITGATTLAGLQAGSTTLSSLNVTGNTTLQNATASTPPAADNSTRVATTAWIRNYVSPIVVVPTNDTSPASPTDGMLWWDSVSGQLYVYYTDVNSSAWIQANTGAGFSVGSGGPFLPLSGGTVVGQVQIAFADDPAYQLTISGTTRATRIRTDANYAYVEGVDATNWSPLGIGGSRVVFFNGGTEVARFENNVLEVSGRVNTATDVTVGGNLLVVATGAPAASTVYASFTSRRIRFRQNSGDQLDAGAIDYRGYDGNALSIVGAGTTGTNRRVRIFDTLEVGGTLTIGGDLTANVISATDNVYGNQIIARGNPNAILNYFQRDNYAINWGFYATGNIARWWNSSYGDRIHLSIDGTCYFFNNVVIPNNCWYYGKNTAGTVINILGLDASNNTTVGHGSFYTYIAGTGVRAHGNFVAPNVNADTEVYAGRSLACGSYLWVNGCQINIDGSGWLTTNTTSVRVWDLISANNLNAAGVLYTAGITWQNYGGWGYSPNGLRAPRIHSDGDNNATGNFAADGGYLYLAGMWLRNAQDGWMHTAWSFRSDAQVRANGNIECGGVITNPWVAGPYLQCYGSGFWDRHAYVTDINANFYISPDRSGGIYIYYTGWLSDVRWKTNIRDTEIDALGVLRATPVRAFEWTDEGLTIDNYFNRPREEYIGFVAQEIERHIPEAVTILDATPHKSRAVVAAGFVPYLVRAVQQLVELNAKLEARIAQLEAR